MVSLQATKETPGALSFKMQAYLALKGSILEMDIYGQRGEIRIDDREVCQMLGISRTPVREALILLEHEGFVRTVPRHGVVVARKSRTQIADMILVWAALEGMAARLAASHADEADLIRLAERFPPGPAQTPDRAADLHQSLVQLSNCALIGDLTRNLAPHMRAIHRLEQADETRAAQATAMQNALIAALTARDGALAERLILRHHFDLNQHIQRTCAFLD
jgi:DNA-binding GntR family transcriptional regulator